MKNNNKKKRSKSKKGKHSYLKYCIITIIIVLLGAGVYFFLTLPDDETSLTVLEKRWIMRNKKTLIDVNVPNNLSILADDGEGVVFDYLKKVEKDTGLGLIVTICFLSYAELEVQCGLITSSLGGTS